MFSRAVFYALRDVATALSGQSDARLRFSDSALELEFRLPEFGMLRFAVPFWLKLGAGSLALMMCWVLETTPLIGRILLTLFGLGWLVTALHTAPTYPRVGQAGRDVVRLRYSTADDALRFELLPPAHAPLPLGPALPLTAISAVRIWELRHPHPKHPPLGLVEVQTPDQPYRLFALLPSEAAARELARALRLLAGLPAAPPRAWWQRETN